MLKRWCFPINTECCFLLRPTKCHDNIRLAGSSKPDSCIRQARRQMSLTATQALTVSNLQTRLASLLLHPRRNPRCAM